MPVSPDNLDIEGLLQTIPLLRGADAVKLSSSAVNNCWHVQTCEEDWFLRQDTALVQSLGLQRVNEVAVLQSLAGSALAPELLWHDLDKGLLVTSWWGGDSLSTEELCYDANLEQLGKLLKHIHSHPADVPALDMTHAASCYAAMVSNPTASELAQSVDELSRQWCSDPDRQVLCHNDPTSGNVLKGSAHHRLVDWEYAGLNEPYFDLAVVIAHHELDEVQQEIFLGAYGLPGSALEADRLAGCVALYGRLSALWLMAVNNGAA